MKKILILMLALLLAVGASACSSQQSGTGDAPQETEKSEAAHTIAVLVYDRTDDEVLSFKSYLEDYIAKEFDVKFLYSDSISTPEEALSFIEDASEYGAEGVMSFNSYDLKKEVDFCAEKGMYFMMASGTVTEEAFESVQDNEYFLGVIGPGDEIEYMAGSNLAEHAISAGGNKDEKEFFILSGGAPIGNEMHRLRTVGIIEKLESAYGAAFDKEPEEIAASEKPMMLEADGLKLCVCPGYPGMDGVEDAVTEAFKSGSYNFVLGVLPVTKFMKQIGRNANIGVVDCYSESNLIMFNDGLLRYVTGKYSSIIGPSFAAMYNAITGHADEFRDNGKAFRIKQGFWSSDSREDFDEKYSIASSIEKVAYNYEDLQKVMKEYNPDATLDDLTKLAEAYTYEDAMARRAE